MLDAQLTSLDMLQSVADLLGWAITESCNATAAALGAIAQRKCTAASKHVAKQA